MKLKYFLRGLGLGIVLTAIIMGITLGRNTAKMNDDEIKQKAKQLGMVEAESTLSSYSELAKITEATDEANNTASDSQVDEKGEEISEEDDEAESSAGESVSDVAAKEEESTQVRESSESIESAEDVKLASDDGSNASSTETVEEEKTEIVEEQKNEPSEQPQEQSQKEPENKTSGTENVKEEQPAPVQEESAAVQPANAGDTNYIVVVLPSGSDSDDCARILREAGVVADGVEFNNYLISTGKDRYIRSGTKQIPRGASFEEITSIITR